MLATLFAILFIVAIISRIATRIRKAFAEVMALPMAPTPKVVPSVEKDLEQDTYFSYEQEMVENVFHPEKESVSESSMMSNFETMPTSVCQNKVDFDLRQAVIYQTILYNPYLTETRQ